MCMADIIYSTLNCLNDRPSDIRIVRNNMMLMIPKCHISIDYAIYN
jgi:hypothetical protein